MNTDKNKHAAWSDAYEAKWNEWTAKFVPRDPNTIPDLPKPRKKLSDAQFDYNYWKTDGWDRDADNQ